MLSNGPWFAQQPIMAEIYEEKRIARSAEPVPPMTAPAVGLAAKLGLAFYAGTRTAN